MRCDTPREGVDQVTARPAQQTSNSPGLQRLSHDELDLTRALLTAFAARGQPVHTLAIAAELRRRRCSVDTQAVLPILSLLQEAQKLPGGFWIPAPGRIVTHTAMSWVTSCLATRDLHRVTPVRLPEWGFARRMFSDFGALPHFPMQEWIAAPRDTISWTAEQLAGDARHMSATSGNVRFEVYRHWPGTGARWRSAQEIPNALFRNRVLCRIKHSPPQYSYFVCEVHRGAVRAVADIPQDRNYRWRLQIGLSALNGQPESYVAKQREGRFAIECRPVPSAEMRVLLALANVDSLEEPRMFETDAASYQVLREVLNALGLKERMA